MGRAGTVSCKVSAVRFGRRCRCAASVKDAASGHAARSLCPQSFLRANVVPVQVCSEPWSSLMGLSTVALASLTPRSSGPAAAASVSRVCGAFGTFAHPAYTGRLRRPLTSNVRPRKTGVQASQPPPSAESTYSRAAIETHRVQNAYTPDHSSQKELNGLEGFSDDFNTNCNKGASRRRAAPGS